MSRAIDGLPLSALVYLVCGTRPYENEANFSIYSPRRHDDAAVISVVQTGGWISRPSFASTYEW